MIIRAIQDEIPKSPISIFELYMNDILYAENNLNITEWPDNKKLSDRMIEIIDKDSFNYTADSMSVKICTEHSSHVMNSYPMVVYCVCKYFGYQNIMHAIRETANAGADADSNASMVGAILGASLGFSDIPSDMIKGIRNYNNLIKNVNAFEIGI